MINLMFDLFIGFFFWEYLLFNNLEKRLLASKQIIKPINKIDKIKIYRWLKLIKINSNNRTIDVISLFNKFCDIKYFQNFS